VKITVTVTPEPFVTEIDVSFLVEEGKSTEEIAAYAAAVAAERFVDTCREGEYPELREGNWRVSAGRKS